jgi:predicted Zn-dependent protease
MQLSRLLPAKGLSRNFLMQMSFPVFTQASRAMRNNVFYGVMALLLTACAVSPTGRKQLLLMNNQQMSAMGVQAFNQLKQDKPIDQDPRINAYVQCVAGAVTSQLSGGRSTWEVRVFQDKSANAFALPGGKIGVNTGLFQVARNPDQLAAVIGHEVGHVQANHSNERTSQQMMVQGGLAAVDAFYGAKLGANRDAAMQGLGLGAEYGVLMPYSRTQESEADLIGLELMARAGFDPRQSLQLWQNMAASGGGQPPEFLSTHPGYETRMRDLQANMGKAMQLYQAAQAQGRRPNCG